MYAVFRLKAPDGTADLGYFADLRTRETVLDVDKVLWIRTITRIKVVRYITRLVFEKVVVGIESMCRDKLADIVRKSHPLFFRHVEIECFEQTSIEKSFGKIGEGFIARFLPLLYVIENIRVIEFEMLFQP